MSTSQLASRMVLERCSALGFARAGVAAAGPSERPGALRAWLAEGRHGEMAYLERTEDVRLDPARLLPGVRSLICVADRCDEAARPARAGSGRVARYARGADYHRLIKSRLHRLSDELRLSFPQEQFRTCVDTAPVLEREHAQRAGIGAVGKHTLVIAPGAGSHLLLGEILTTLELEPTAPSRADPCGSCTRCIDACPTGAITPWSVDARACISYLTIEHRSAIDPGLHAAMGDWIFGCDVCQEVCPHNQRSGPRQPSHPGYAGTRDGFDLLRVLDWSAEARQHAFLRSPMKRANLAMMKRNALIAAGNALRERELPELRRRIAELAGDPSEDPMVRQTASATLSRLG
jgi:epoxyqueuosine reductase